MPRFSVNKDAEGVFNRGAKSFGGSKALAATLATVFGTASSERDSFPGLEEVPSTLRS